MLNPDFAPAEPPLNTLIAGQRCGKQVHCSPQAKLAFDEIEALSRKGNHWARLAIKGIHGLSAGRITMNNVYTKDADPAYGRGTFYVTLPGIIATFESLSNDSFKLTSLEADDTFFEQQQNFTKPGLWRVEKTRSGHWKTEHVTNERLSKNKEKRYVAITDRDYNSPDAAAHSAALGFAEVSDSIRRIIEDDGFDLHFTPGSVTIGGLKNSKEATSPETEESLQESSQLLAYTMNEAESIKSVTWYSDWGGSGILTQAMRHLVDQSVTLDKHCILMNHPTTRPRHAEALASKLGLDPITGGKKGIMPSELIGRVAFFDTPISIYRRLKEDEKYNAKHVALECSKGIYNSGNVVTGAIGATGTVLGAAGIITGSPAILVGAGIVGAAYFVSSIAIKLYQGRRR